MWNIQLKGLLVYFFYDTLYDTHKISVSFWGFECKKESVK